MVESKGLKYRNVTISGLPGAGSSTLGRALAKKLGWEYFIGGDFMRAYAVKKGVFDKRSPVHHAATVYEDGFDRKVDYKMRETLEKDKGNVLDAWLSGFMAQGVERVFKVMVYCSKDSIRVDRVVNRDRVSVEEAKHHIFEREESNLKKWTRLYKKEWEERVPKEAQTSRRAGNFDFYNPKLYDLSIDTLKNSREESLAQVLKELGYKKD